jgi:hypothetical protein
MDQPSSNGNSASVYPLSGSTLTNAAGHTIAGAGLLGAGDVGTIINQGTIHPIGSIFPGLGMDPRVFVNTGTVLMGSGDMLDFLFTGAGIAIDNTAGQVTNNGGRCNVGHGNTLSGGVLNFTNGGILTGDGAISNITIPTGSDVILPGGSTFEADNTITVNGILELLPHDNARAGIYIEGNVTLNGTGELLMDQPSPNGHYAFVGPFDASSTLTIAAGQTVIGNGFCYLGYKDQGTVINQGTVIALNAHGSSTPGGFNLDATSYSNSGTITAGIGASLTLDFAGVQVNNTGGVFQINGATFATNTAVIGGGTITLAGGAALTGSGTLSSVALNLSGNSSASEASVQSATSGSGVVIAAGSSLAATSTYTQSAGSTDVEGSLVSSSNPVNISGGQLSGGGSITGTLNLAPASTYNAVLGGTSTGLYDNLAVNGSASLGTAGLMVMLTGGFTPAAGQSFTILHSSGSLSGTFAQGTTVTSGPYTFAIAYSGSSVVLTPTPVTITTGALSSWTANQAGYRQTINAASGTAPYTFSASGTLPPGLILSSGGVLAGTPTAPGSFSFVVTATDAVGGTARQNYSVMINPAVTITTTALPSGQAFQPGYDQPITASGGTGTVTFTASGMLPTGLTLSSGGVLAGTPSSAGTYTFTVTATDVVGASGAMNYDVSVVPPTPTQLVITVPSSTSAGMAFNLTVSAHDNAGHAATGFSGAVSLSSSAMDLTPTTVTLTNGTATISATLTSAGADVLTAGYPGLSSGTCTVTVTPGPLAQYLAASLGIAQVKAGKSFAVTVQAADAFGNPIIAYTGPSSAAVSSSPSGAVGNIPTTVSIDHNGFGIFLASLQEVGTYTLGVAAGSYTGNTAPVTVTAGPAVKLAFAAQPASRPTGVVLPPVTVQIVDAYGNVVTSDNSDSVAVAVAGGPGLFTASTTTTATAQAGVATFTNLTLTVPGTYMLSAKVPALYIGPNSNAFSIQPLQVVPGSFVGSPSGFSLQFNAPYLVNAQTPILYGQGFGPKATPPSVLLTTDPGSLNDSAAYVAGSLVLDQTTNRITFVATNTALKTNYGSPLLRDGAYTAVIRSSPATNGFRALNNGGGFLDGLGSGLPGSGDFTASFTVNSAAAGQDVLWVPATADGPGQPLSAPGMNQVGGGFPLYVDDHIGNVTKVQVTLNYNPALLTVTGVQGTSLSLLGTSTPGQAVLQYSGPALATGTQSLVGFLQATVPSGSAGNPIPYRSQDLLHLSAASLNDGAIAVATSDAVHLVAYVGDADGTGSYSSGDAVLITNVALETDTGFAAYPLVDPVIVADTDGSGFIPADAALQANEAGVGFPTANLPIPPLPGGTVFHLARSATHEPLAPPMESSLSSVVHSNALTLVLAPAHRRDARTDAPRLQSDQITLEMNWLAVLDLTALDRYFASTAKNRKSH